jgi:hypothetical protein
MSAEEQAIKLSTYLNALKLSDPSEIKDVELIQELWSGYGELSRLRTKRGSYILKLIEFPNHKKHPRGWASDIGHERKVKSYRVERYWYQHYETSRCEARMASGISSGEIEGREYLLLEDLKDSEFDIIKSCSWEETKMCLKWLADFHRYFMGARPDGLWPVGTYWHLETRPDELEVMDDEELKEAAPLIDRRLNEARYQTFVHGDAKLANFLVNQKEAAAVDFQYVGGGVGIKDVAYFLSSLYHENELAQYEEKCLDTYFHFLALPEVEEEWRALYPFAWADFYRFLKGWSLGHWKLNSYSERMREEALKCL